MRKGTGNIEPSQRVEVRRRYGGAGMRRVKNRVFRGMEPAGDTVSSITTPWKSSDMEWYPRLAINPLIKAENLKPGRM